MQGEKLLQSIRLKNLLSYGSEGETLELEPLNVLIGPNASGKSNLIEAVSVLAAAPRDIKTPILEGGGVSEWIWKGEANGAIKAEIEVCLHYPSFRYRLEFMAQSSQLRILTESLENEVGPGPEPYSYYSFAGGKASIKTLIPGGGERIDRELSGINLEQSFLSQRKDADLYPEATSVGSAFSKIAFFRDWT